MSSSINNWLAFSLSPQQLHTDGLSQPPQHPQRLISGDSSGMDFPAADDMSGEVSGDCFNMSTDSPAAPSMQNPFGILEALNRTHQPQEWNTANAFKTMESMPLVGGSRATNTDAPKLEDFLGGSSSGAGADPMYSGATHSFGNGAEPKISGCDALTSGSYEQNSGDYMFSDCSLQLPATAGGNNSIGLSMIKSWLRNQPAPMDTKNSCSSSSVTANTASAATGNLPNMQTLSLSMSTGSQSSSPAPVRTASGGGGGAESSSSENRQRGLDSQTGAIEPVPRKSIDTFGQRTSIYRGVTRHRWTGRYEAHLWDNSCRREGQTRKGRQVYLGGYDKEEKAARAYDLAALKYWGTTTTTNFPISNYEKELEEMKHMTRQEYVASLRRKSSGFSRGASIYRGVTRHHQHGRWQARIGRVAGNKDLYLGTFSTQEEAAEAYDIAAIKFRGLNAVTNFDMSRYDVKSILESSTLPIGGAAKRLKEAESSETSVDGRRTDSDNLSSNIADAMAGYPSHHGWPIIAFQQPQPLSQQHYPFLHQQRSWCKQEQDNTMQDLQQLHMSNTHNFLQPSSVIHNLMSLQDSSSLDQGSSSGVNYQGVVNGGLVLPLNPMMTDHNQAAAYGDGDMKKMGSSSYDNILQVDPYSSRNLYYLSQQQSAGLAKPGGGGTNSYEQDPNCNSWAPNSVQQMAPRSNLSVCHGAPIFTVWSDT
ncbi:unnamed protein product [Victoria cruziana]